MNPTLQNNKLFHAIFGYSEGDCPFRLRTILEISQPLLFELEYQKETYLLYVLRDTTKIIDGTRIPVQELLGSKVESDIVSKLTSSEISIHDAFFSADTVWRVGKIGDKIFPPKHVKNSSDIADRFPKQDVKLNELPNTAKYI